MSRITLITLGLLYLGATIASLVTKADRALITPAPVLQRRDLPSNFMGYEVHGNSLVNYWTCKSPYTYSSSNGYAGCAGGGGISDYIGSKCSSTLLTDLVSSVWTCSGYCATATVYNSTDDSDPALFVDCWPSSIDFSLLRTYISDVPSTRATETTVFTTVVFAPTPPSITTTPTTQPNPTNNAAVIAGAVIGALVLAALVGLGLFFLFRRRSRGGGHRNPGSFSDQTHQPVSAPPQPYIPAMNQAYVSPMGFQPIYQPGPGSPPPIYGHDKPTNVATTQQMEYRLPDGTAEVDGISSPHQFNQPPQSGPSELGSN